MNTNLIGIVGWIGTGKDTIADYLVAEHNFQHESFAGSLKDAVSAVFGWDRAALEGSTPAARKWREQVDEWWADRLNMPGFTPRKALQLWGTEVCRENFHEDIWLASLENKLRHNSSNIVISDCRFQNEVEMIKRLGGKLIWVQRGETPSWYPTGKRAAQGYKDDIDAMSSLNVHASEWSWLNANFDKIIKNDGTILELYTQLNDLIISDGF